MNDAQFYNELAAALSARLQGQPGVLVRPYTIEGDAEPCCVEICAPMTGQIRHLEEIAKACAYFGCIWSVRAGHPGDDFKLVIEIIKD